MKRACWRRPGNPMKGSTLHKDSAASPQGARGNPMLWLVIGLPVLAVIASFASLALAIMRGDSELPKSYHWEGAGLAQDQARIDAAARLGLRASVAVDAAARRCTVSLQGDAPPAVRLILTHPTDARADLSLTLPRSGVAYAAPCTALRAAHWWLQLADDQGRWMLRGRAQGTLQEAAPLAADRGAAAEVD
jgi:uncharacterized protein